MATLVKAAVKAAAQNPVPVTIEDAEAEKKEHGSMLCYLFTYYGG